MTRIIFRIFDVLGKKPIEKRMNILQSETAIILLIK